MKLDLNDFFVFSGIAMAAGGVGYQYGPAYGAILAGVAFFFIGYRKA